MIPDREAVKRMKPIIQLHEIGSYMLRQYLLETPAGWIAVDSGYAGGFAAYQKRLRRLTAPDQVTFVFLTHAHNDHAGFLAEMIGKTRARLVACESSLPRIASGENAMPEGM